MSLANAGIPAALVEAGAEALQRGLSIIDRNYAGICKPGAILAAHTSYQDVNAIAAVTNRPQDVLGTHF